MALIKDGVEAKDSFVNTSHLDTLPASGDIIVSLDQWNEQRDALLARGTQLGVTLKSDQHPDSIADDLQHFALVALEFPAFTDGRAYSYARILRDQYGFAKELRAVGDVLLEQLLYMNRVGINAFDILGDNDLEQWKVAAADYTVWYQPTNDGRKTIRDLRNS
ncbi:MAG: DUF934 domain-containing protein [Chromatiales bacterium]|jgi:uncharacterized protein (DUF934 family)|nr:DUF934 domain-containing protein [Chromatiales bacterium]